MGGKDGQSLAKYILKSGTFVAQSTETCSIAQNAISKCQNLITIL